MKLGKENKFYPGEVKNILITGGAGFLGSHLCDRLMEEGNVICVDNLVGGGNINNVKPLLQRPNFRFIKHDVNQPLDMGAFQEIRDFRVDVHGLQEIYHLACPTSAKNFNQLRVETLQANSLGILNILELAKAYKARMLFTSSSVVYGPKKAGGFYKENEAGTVNFTGPRSCYDEGKRFAETAIVTYRDFYGLEAKIVRVFRTYGPREMLFDGQMIPDFVLQALTNKPLVIYGDENFSTSLCYVSDMVEGLIKTMESKERGPINLGHPQEHKLADLARKIIDMTGSQSKIEFRPPLLFMTPLGMPDISLAREKLGWFPVTRIEDGLKEIIEYVKANWMLLQPLVDRYERK